MSRKQNEKDEKAGTAEPRNDNVSFFLSHISQFHKLETTTRYCGYVKCYTTAIATVSLKSRQKLIFNVALNESFNYQYGIWNKNY